MACQLLASIREKDPIWTIQILQVCGLDGNLLM